MFLLQILLAVLVVSLTAVNYVVYVLGTSDSAGEVAIITDPIDGRGVLTGTIDRTDTAGGPSSGSPSGGSTASRAYLSWMAPLARENGEALAVNDIGAYKIRYEKEGSSQTWELKLSPSKTDATISLTSKGTYWFSVAAVDTEGVSSSYSEKVSKIIN